MLNLETPVTSEVTSDGSGRRGRGVRRAGQGAEALDHAIAGDAERDDRTAFHELDERLIERLALVLGIVRRKQGAIGLQQLHVDEGVTFRLDAAQDFAGEVTGNAIRLDQYEGLFDLGAHAISF